MNRVSRDEVQAYCCAVQKHCPHGSEKRTAAALRGDVLDFVADNPDASIEDVTAHFGTPQQLVAALSEEKPRRTVSTYRLVLLGVAAAVLIVLVTAAACAYMLQKPRNPMLPYHAESGSAVISEGWNG